MIPKTMRAKTVTFVLWFLFVFSVFFCLHFFFTLFSAEWHAGPPKNITGRKTVFILARHQICTVHEKSKNQSHCPGSRLGMVESGSGSVRSWPKGGQGPFTIGGAICWDGEQRRCEGLHASMGQNGRPPGNECCDSCLSQVPGG